MTLECQITHDDGTTETSEVLGSKEKRHFQRMNIATLNVGRTEYQSHSWEEDLDEVTLIHNGTDMFSGIIRDKETGGTPVQIHLDSMERYAMDGVRSGAGIRYEGVPYTDVLDDIFADMPPQISKGTIDTITDSNGDEKTGSWIFSYASPAKRLREVAMAVDAEVLYHPDGSVDVVSRLGSDRTSSTLSRSNGELTGEFKPNYQGGTERITHLIMLGAGEGEEQRAVLLVPDNDSDDYSGDRYPDRVVEYTSSTWSQGDRKQWDARTNKDITAEDTLEEHGRLIIDEADDEYVDLKMTVEQSDVNLGDEFNIQNSAENFNRDLRAVEVTRLIDADGRRYETTFSNRRNFRTDESSRVLQDVERYNKAFEGTAVNLTPSGGRQTVGPQKDYLFFFYYPDEIKHEHRVDLHIKSFAFTTDSIGTAGNVSNVEENEVGFDTITTTGDTCNVFTLPDVETPWFKVEVDDTKEATQSDLSGGYFVVNFPKPEPTYEIGGTTI